MWYNVLYRLEGEVFGMNYFITSDIHGCIEEFEELLTHWNKKDTLVIMGDLIDRGENSLKVIQLIMELKEEYGDRVIVLQGNHDSEFCDFAFTPEDNVYLYYLSRFNPTILSFFDGDKKKFQKSTRIQRQKHIMYKYRKEIFFLKNLPYYYESEHIVFVHAGVDLEIDDWRESTPDFFIWAREEFYNESRQIGKRIFFGHNALPSIHKDTAILIEKKGNERGFKVPEDRTELWISPEGDKVCIDGGCSYGYNLNGVLVNPKGEIISVIKIQKK